MSLPHTDFWTWSLDRYERSGAAEILLRLQDEYGLNVNLLLWCCWCAEYFEAAPPALVREAENTTRDWNARVTAPLRSVRRHLKQGEDGEKKQRKALRKSIKDAELAAEKVEQARLEAVAARALAPAADRLGGAERAEKNLRAYVEQAGLANREGVTPLLSDLVRKLLAETP